MVVQELEDSPTYVTDFKEVNILLQKMKELLPNSIRYPVIEPWYIQKIIKLRKYGIYKPNLSDWFYDSLIEVNKILQKEFETGKERVIKYPPNYRYGARNIASISCYCIFLPEYNAYRSAIDIGFKNLEEKNYDAFEMMYTSWPCIVQEFGLL